MTDTTPGKDNTPTSPEQLQSELRRLYFALPPYVHARERRRLLRSEYHDPKSIEEAIVKDDWHRIQSETKPIIVKKFQDAILKAGVTPSFMQAIAPLVEDTHASGRRWGTGELAVDDLFRALQLHSDTGIYAKDGAAKGEAFLFNKVLDNYLDEVQVTWNYSEGFDGHFLRKWAREYQDFYGKPLDLSKLGSS